ncbi:hypothetical protein [Paracoccus pacificus]|uniref:TnsA endonuclease N terminal n=1 Tax=Paracoccus pacificus TaxID=1463598 RepID=A0ABW4R7R3_9RHOB
MSDDDDKTPWQPPQRSTGTRSFPARSKSSSRGFLLAHLPAEARPRQIIYESNLERQTALLLLARNDLWNLWDQPPKIAFTDKWGRTAHHVFDYLAEFNDGRRVAIAVKPQARTERIGFRDTLARIRTNLPPRFADEVVLVTEKTLPAAVVHNAELLQMFRACPDPEADRIVGDMLAAQKQPFRIADVVADSRLGGRAFRALVRAIHAGLTRADLDSRITSATVLLPPEDWP